MAEVKITTRLEDSLLAKVKAIAKREHRSVNSLLIVLMEEYVAAHGNDNGALEDSEYVPPPDRIQNMRKRRDQRAKQ